MYRRKYDFSSKVALVINSDAGIGAAIAIALAEYGCKVAITGASRSRLDAVANEIGHVSYGGRKPLQIIGDLLDVEMPKKLINATVDYYRRLDLLVNVASVASTGKNSGFLLDNSQLLTEFDTSVRLNMRASIDLIQRAMPYLAQTRGNVLNICPPAADPEVVSSSRIFTE